MYKYYRISNEDAILGILGKQCSIKFSSAFKLNDPYELKFNLIIDPTSKRARSDYFKVNPGHIEADFESWKTHASNSSTYTAWTQRNEIAQSVTMSSFSRTNNNNLMWSHYTDVHSGICVSYRNDLIDCIKSKKGFFAYGPVKYSTQPPTISNNERPKTIIKKSMFNKQIEWKYEKEFRIVRLSNEDIEYISIPQKTIAAVYLGARIDQRFRQLILDICKEAKIEIFHASTMASGYEVSMYPHDEKKIYMTSFWG